VAPASLGEAHIEHRIATIHDIAQVIDHGDADALAIGFNPQAHGVRRPVPPAEHDVASLLLRHARPSVERERIDGKEGHERVHIRRRLELDERDRGHARKVSDGLEHAVDGCVRRIGAGVGHDPAMGPPSDEPDAAAERPPS